MNTSELGQSFRLENVSKWYGNQEALSGINWSIEKGSFVALMGPNGSGKSTLLRLLAQHEQTSRGELFYDGHTLSSSLNPILNDAVFISEDSKIPDGMSLSDWSEFFAGDYPNYDTAVFKSLAKALNVNSRQNFSELSRGQKMKAFFCLMAPKKPLVYLIDEITAVLDVGSRFEIVEFLKTEIQRGCTVVMSTNIGSEVQEVASDVCFLEEGCLKLSCKKQQAQDSFKKIIVKNPSFVEGLKKQNVRPVSINSDGSVSMLYQSDQSIEITDVPHDKRLVTIEDLATYFSTNVGRDEV